MTTVENADALGTPFASRVCTAVALAGAAVGLVCLLAGNGLPSLSRKLAQVAAAMGEAAAPLSLIVGSIALLLTCLRFPRFGRFVGAILEWPLRIVFTAFALLVFAAISSLAVAMSAVAAIGWSHGMGVPISFLAPSVLPPTVVFGGFVLGVSLTALTYCRVSFGVTGNVADAKMSRRDKAVAAALAAFLLLVLPGGTIGSKALGEAKVLHRAVTTASPADATAPPAR